MTWWWAGDSAISRCIAIANSDAAANAMTKGTIDEAHRAVQEILVSRG